MKKDFEQIKKKYGEDFAKFCRTHFSTILETDGLLLNILEQNFYPTKFLFNDLVKTHSENNFINYIYSKYYNMQQEIEIAGETGKTPEELLAIAGYKLYKCETHKDVLSFKKYYDKDEELCTFDDPFRIQRNEIFFAVKNNVDQIHRYDFFEPDRQDDYGTSVISIQFSKKSKYLSIKNRYNHAVEDPDSTFSNNLDNIIPGLTKSFETYYGLSYVPEENEEFPLKNYTQTVGGKFINYNTKYLDTYFCSNNIVIINNEIVQYDKARYEVIDNFIIDRKEKTITSTPYDGFCDRVNGFKFVDVAKIDNKTKQIKFILQDDQEVVLIVNEKNQIIEYIDKNITKTESHFLYSCESIEKIVTPNLDTTGHKFVCKSPVKHLDAPNLRMASYDFLNKSAMQELSLQHLTCVGGNFLDENNSLKVANFPNLVDVGSYFLSNNHVLEQINVENLESVDFGFLTNNNSLKSFSAPKLTSLPTNFLMHAPLEDINLPNIKYANDNCLCRAKVTNIKFNHLTNVESSFMSSVPLISFEAPNLEAVGGYFLHNYQGKSISLPMLKKSGWQFMHNALNLKEINVPNLYMAGQKFLANNEKLEHINAPWLTYVEKDFLSNNKSLRAVKFESLKKADSYFLYRNEGLKTFIAPNLEYLNPNSLYYNVDLQEFYAPNLIGIGDYVLTRNRMLEEFYSPFLEGVGDMFLFENKNLKVFNTPKLERVGDALLAHNTNNIDIYAPKVRKLDEDSLRENPEARKTVLSKFTKLKSFLKRIKIFKMKDENTK